MEGQGRVLAGAVCGTEKFINDVLLPFQRNTGPNLSPFNAWVVLKGLETLDLRARRQSENALAVGKRSEEHTSELQSLMRLSYAVFCLQKKTDDTQCM